MAEQPDPALVLRAYQLWRDRWTLRAIAEEIGVRSPETVRNYIERAQAAEQWRDAQARDRRVDRMTAFLNTLAAMGVARLEEKDQDGRPVHRYEDIVPPLMKVVGELNRVEGNYAPIRSMVTTDRRPADPELIRLMEQEAARAEALDADEVRRELEQ